MPISLFGFLTQPGVMLTEEDIKDIVEVKKVREHLHLDYKGEPYGNGREEIVEMLADITAIANASGGLIIVGVTEDRQADDGTPAQLIGIENADREANRITGLCVSGIDEPIVGLRIYDVPLSNSNGRGCVIIHVPNSFRKPHMINHSRHHSFRMRNERSKRFMDMAEVRNMILSMNVYRDRLDRFLDQRKAELIALGNGRSGMAMFATPVYVDNEKIDPISNNRLRQILQRPPSPVDDRFEGNATWRYVEPQARIYGCEVPLSNRDGYFQVVRLLRNGHFEYWQADILDGDADDLMKVDAYRTTVYLLQFLETAKLLMQTGNITEPFAITVFLHNVEQTVLNRGRNFVEREQLVWRDSSLTIDFIIPALDDSVTVAHQIMNRLFNAYGYDRCTYFNDVGEFVVRQRV